MDKLRKRRGSSSLHLIVIGLTQSLGVFIFGAAVGSVAQTPMPLKDTQMSMPVSEDAPEHAKYTCSSFSDDSAKARAAAALSVQTYDKNALACAADLRFEL